MARDGRDAVLVPLGLVPFSRSASAICWDFPSEFIQSLKILLNKLHLKILELKNNVRENITEEKVMASCWSNSFLFNTLAVVFACVCLCIRWVRSVYYCLLSELNLKMFSPPTFHLPSYTLILVISSTFLQKNAWAVGSVCILRLLTLSCNAFC